MTRSLRSVLVFFWMAVTVIPFASVIIICAPFIGPDARWWYLARPWLQGAVEAVRLVGGIQYTVIGEEYLPAAGDNQRIILCPKHQSTWETFFFASRMPRPLAYVFKRELLYVPFFGWAMACLNMIHIDRGARGDAWKKVASLGGALMDRGKWVIMFPEGTRILPGQKGKYHIGGAWVASKTNTQVIPVAHNAGLFWPKNSILKKPGTIKVSIGEAIDVNNKEPDEIIRLTENWIEKEVLHLND